MNWHAVRVIYLREMARSFRTLTQSILAPVISTVLYFVVFGSAIGQRMQAVDGVSYGAFIVPGLIMLTVLQLSVDNGSFGIYLPKWSGTMFEILAAPVSWIEIVLGFVGAAATKSVLIAALILGTAYFFVDVVILHPVAMIALLFLTAITFALLGFVIGIWAKSWEQLQMIPMLIITPLVFLGGAFYSASMLPPFWEMVTRFNPVLYIISAYRWSFFGVADVPVMVSLTAISAFLAVLLILVARIFHTGWRLRA